MRNHIGCICLTFPHYVFSNVSSPWEYFDLQGPWKKVLTYHKKSLYTLQADPEKSRDFIFPNPGIFTNWKSRDPGIPGIPLGPAQLSLISTIRAEQSLRWVGKSAVGSSRIWSSLTSWFLVDKIFRFINLPVRSWNAVVPSKIASRKFLRGSSFLLWKVDDLRLKIVNCSCET